MHASQADGQSVVAIKCVSYYLSVSEVNIYYVMCVCNRQSEGS
jgi:hypothetical protein